MNAAGSIKMTQMMIATEAIDDIYCEDNPLEDIQHNLLALKKDIELKKALAAETRNIRSFLKLLKGLGATKDVAKLKETVAWFRSRLFALSSNPESAGKCDWVAEWGKGR